jgi:hypothetical protein
MTDLLKILMDIGLGAIAYRLTTQLGSVVKTMQIMLGDHESRIVKLEDAHLKVVE